MRVVRCCLFRQCADLHSYGHGHLLGIVGRLHGNVAKVLLLRIHLHRLEVIPLVKMRIEQ